MDAFGSNATAKGGIFGRIDSVYGAIECQKSGTLHVHIQAFVQCYHQFTPLVDLLKLGNQRLVEMLRRYSSYSAHVRRMVYCNPHQWQEELEEVEAEWPEYKTCSLMVSRPAYQAAEAASCTAEEWKAIYLSKDVEELQRGNNTTYICPLDQLVNGGPSTIAGMLRTLPNAKVASRGKGGLLTSCS